MLHSLIKQATRTPCRRVVSLLGLTSIVGLTMLAFRLGYSGRRGYVSLPWDLFLAWLPVLFALGVARLAARREAFLPHILVCAFFWLLFFPNAPYLVTEFMHLHPTHAVHDGPHILSTLTPHGPIPIWFDVLMLATFAWTGLMLGFVSLHLIHRTVARVAGSAIGWAGVVAGAALCAFGVSLGRFERWNSWDLFTHPRSLLVDVLDRAFNPLAHPRTSASTIGFAAFLLLGYLTLAAMMNLSEQEHAA
jgi:uncharacterized membrane protein